MGGKTLPTASTAGYTTYEGHVTCECVAEWLSWLERLCIAHGYIKFNLDILQLTGGNPLSGGTHAKGGCFDLSQFDQRIVALAREMGAPATWMRPWENNHHTHGVLSGCPHNSPARYQIDAQRKGRDGLGKAGLAGPDTHPSPKVYRTWQQGIAWAKSEIVRLTPPTAIKEIPVALDQTDINRIADAILWAKTFPNQDEGLGSSSIRNNIGIGAANAQTAVKQLSTLTSTVNGIAVKVGADKVDEAALAREVSKLLLPTLSSVIDKKLAAGVAPAALAQAVVAEMGKALGGAA